MRAKVVYMSFGSDAIDLDVKKAISYALVKDVQLKKNDGARCPVLSAGRMVWESPVVSVSPVGAAGFRRSGSGRTSSSRIRMGSSPTPFTGPTGPIRRFRLPSNRGQ